MNLNPLATAALVVQIAQVVARGFKDQQREK